jgi:hypothetical protein
MSDGELLRDLAHFRSLETLLETGTPDREIITQVNALIAAGNLDGAWRLLNRRPWPTVLNLKGH